MSTALATTPVVFDQHRWAVHLAGMLDEWTDDFTIGTATVARHIDTVTVTVDGRASQWRPTGAGAGAVATAGTPAPDLAVAMAEDVWHEQWPETAEPLARLRGRWLHPETRWSIDPYSLPRHTAALFIGCVDMTAPTAPRRFDADLDPVGTDQDVIAFPVLAGTALEHLAAGYDAYDAGVGAVIATIVNGAIHEAFELFQHAPGQPVLDPHRPHLEVTADVTLHGRQPDPLYPAGTVRST